MPKTRMTLEAAGREVSISSPDKIYFPVAGYSKLDVIEYYLAVAEGALAAGGGRPLVMKRYINGVTKEAFVPRNRGQSGSRRSR